MMEEDEESRLEGFSDVVVLPVSKQPAYLGVIVVLIAVSQVSATELTRVVQEGGFEAPFFIMVVHAALLSPLYVVGRRWERHNVSKAAAKSSSVTVVDEKMTWRTAWTLLMAYFGANYCFTRALSLAPASWVQAVFGTAPAIVAVLSKFWLGEAGSARRWVGVAGAICGIVILAFAAGSEKTDVSGFDIVLGLVLAQGATLCAATYKVYFKKKLGGPSPAYVLTFVGLLGFLAAVVGFPIAIIFAFTGVEDNFFHNAQDLSVYGVLASGGVLDVAYNTFIALGLACADSPVYIAVATVLAIPLSASCDLLFFDVPITTNYVLGTLLVLVSFAVLSVPPDSKIARYLTAFIYTDTDNNDAFQYQSLHHDSHTSKKIIKKNNMKNLAGTLRCDNTLTPGQNGGDRRPLHLGHDRSSTIGGSSDTSESQVATDDTDDTDDDQDRRTLL